MKNFAKLALERGGSIHPLVIPSKLTNGLGLMNPSILVEDDKIRIILRAVNYTFYHSEKKLFQHQWGPLTYVHPENDIHLRTTNYYLELDENYKITRYDKIDTSKFPDKELWDFVGLEDARIFRWDGKLYTSGVRRDLDTIGTGRMELCEIVVDNEKVTEVSRVRIQPPNNPDSYCEKNWMPVIDRPNTYVKWSNPTEVVEINPETGESKTIFLGSHCDIPRDLRGGSQVIPWKGYYLALTHEVDLFNSEVGRKDAVYYHRIVIWDQQFNLIRWSKEFSLMSGHVEFCIGLAKQNDDLLLTFGFQDNAAYLLKFPEKLIEEFINGYHD
jgi:hypothetical protein